MNSSNTDPYKPTNKTKELKHFKINVQSIISTARKSLINKKKSKKSKRIAFLFF